MSLYATAQAVIVQIDDDLGAWRVFDAVCRRELGLSGEEFLSRWDAGDYEGVDVDDIEGLPEVVSSMRMVR